MVQSINTKVDVVQNATSYAGFATYGKIMVGDKGFEFFDDRNPAKFIQIPWEEVEYVFASIMLKGRWIPRFALQTKKSGTYSFSSKQPKVILRAIRNYIDSDHVVRSLSYFESLTNRFKFRTSKKTR